jgi:hypothetical protein
MSYHVFYHFPCNDGELSRVIWENFEPSSKYYKWYHNNVEHEDEINIINNLPEKSNIVFLDLTPITIIDKLSNKHNYIIIDHHKNPILSLIKKKSMLPNYNILLYTQNGFPEKNDLSGCKLTWLYFKKFCKTKEIKDKEDYPSVVYYIGNKDVWDFSDPNTESYCLGLNSYIKNNNDDNNRIIFLKSLLNNDNNDDKFINIGLLLINSYKEQAKIIFKDYSFDIFDRLNIIDIKCANTGLYKYLIEFAEENFDDSDVLRILHSETDNQKTYSLRSLKEHIKVDEMARFYGGNGHEKAAGYSING